MKLKGNTVIVTGASGGIGRETARRLAKAGSNVVLASRDKKALREPNLSPRLIDWGIRRLWLSGRRPEEVGKR